MEVSIQSQTGVAESEFGDFQLTVMPDVFTCCCSLFETLQTLYWGLYNLIDIEHFNLVEDHVFTEFAGLLMFGVYSCISIVVLLNMLIAMMSNSFQYIAVSAFSYRKKKYFSEGLHDLAVITDADGV